MTLPALGDRFIVEREIGRGGMAIVALAHDRVLDRRVAVKLLAPELSAAVGADRFAREIRVTARLVHPNIVPLFDSGEMNGQLYYVMPFVEGETLRARLDRVGRLTIAETVRLVSDLAEALAYAHGQGIVHRDIKPENVFVYRDRALLADFGIAKALAPASVTTRSTVAGLAVGTAAYMSPEQAAAESDVDGRSDLYSLGCLMFEMASGVPPYRGPSMMAVLAQHFASEVPELPVAAPETFTALLRTMMAKAPADRPASAAIVLEALRPVNVPVESALTPSVAADAPTAVPKSKSMAMYDEAQYNWLRGFQGGRDGREKLEMAMTLFERARELDPQNALAAIGMANTIFAQGYRGFRPFKEARNEARAMRLEALAIDDQLPQVHEHIGVMLLYWDDDVEGAGERFARARALDSTIGSAERFWAVWLKIAGRVEEAIVAARRAVELDPKVPAAHTTLGDVLMTSGRYDEAVAALRTSLRFKPGYEPSLERLELACHRAGRADEALATRRALLGQRGDQSRLAALDEDVAQFGWTAARQLDVRRELARLLEQAAREDPFVDRGTSRQLSDDIICVYAELGEWTSAMDWVERGSHSRPGRLRRVLTDFSFDRRGLAVDPRYAPLLRAAGLEELL